MGSSRVTSFDVAKRAGVSRTTVSLVLNGSESVALSAQTRERVLRAAADLGYQPNSAARMLVSGVSETIGLVVSDPSVLLVDAFIPQVLYGIERANRQMGLHVLVEGLNPGDPQGSYDGLVKSRRIDGLIILNPRSNDDALVSLIEKDFPLVLVGSVRHRKEVSVTFTTRKALATAVDHIIALGHRRIGAVTFSPLGFVSTGDRLEALRHGLGRFDLDIDDDAVAYGNFSPESGHHAALELLTRRPDVTTIFAGNDTIAIGVLSAARQLGRSVPGDLSVIGFDDLHFAPWLAPALTTIHTDGVRQGMIAAEMLFARLGHRELEQPRIRVETQFVIRQSTGPAP